MKTYRGLCKDTGRAAAGAAAPAIASSDDEGRSVSSAVCSGGLPASAWSPSHSISHNTHPSIDPSIHRHIYSDGGVAKPKAAALAPASSLPAFPDSDDELPESLFTGGERPRKGGLVSSWGASKKGGKGRASAGSSSLRTLR